MQRVSKLIGVWVCTAGQSVSRSGGRVVETGGKVSEQKAREATETGNDNVTVSLSVGQLQIPSARVFAAAVESVLVVAGSRSPL